MAPWRLLGLTSLAMIAFAGNSLLCRLALADTSIDAASFTAIRMCSGALVLALLIRAGPAAAGSTGVAAAGNWISAAALFVYAAAFSFAYQSLTAAAGALLLFGAVQVTMVADGRRRGEQLRPLQVAGVALAFGGLVGLTLPGLSAPPLHGAALMIAAGVAWGVYSIRGRGAGNPLRVTAGNFVRTVPMALLLSAASVLILGDPTLDVAGATYAFLSGAVASGLGYAVWYTALPALKAASAATVQLSVPIITAVGAVLLLGESLSLRLLLAAMAILGGIALVIRGPALASAGNVRRAP